VPSSEVMEENGEREEYPGGKENKGNAKMPSNGGIGKRNWF